jgi:glycosyltransferase involved in cell wall biosynthesis
VLADAFITLAKDDRHAAVRLRYAGGWTAGDAPFVRDLRKRLEEAGLGDRVDFVRGFGRADRIRFLKSVSILSVPVPGGEAFGMHLLESLASGVPVVQPDAGGFRELVEATGGGVLYEPGDPDALAAALGELLLDPERARGLGARGGEAVHERFGVEKMAEEMVHLYLQLREREKAS